MNPVKTIGCEEALTHLLEYVDRELGTVKHREVEHHLDICRSCFSRAEFEQRLKAKLREAGRETAGESCGERIKLLLRGF